MKAQSRNIILVLYVLITILHANYITGINLTPSSTFKQNNVEFSDDGTIYAVSNYNPTLSKVYILIYKNTLGTTSFTLSQNITIPGVNQPMKFSRPLATGEDEFILSPDGTAFVYCEYGKQKLFYYKADNGSFPLNPTAVGNIGTMGIGTFRPMGSHFIDNLICAYSQLDNKTYLFEINELMKSINMLQILVTSTQSSQLVCTILDDKSYVLAGAANGIGVYAYESSSKKYNFDYWININSSPKNIIQKGNHLFVSDWLKIWRYSRSSPTTRFGTPLLIDSGSSYPPAPWDILSQFRVTQNGKYIYSISHTSIMKIVKLNSDNQSYTVVQTVDYSVDGGGQDIAVPDNGKYISVAFADKTKLQELKLQCLSVTDTFCESVCPINSYMSNLDTLYCPFCTNKCSTCSGSTCHCTSCPANRQLKGIRCLTPSQILALGI